MGISGYCTDTKRSKKKDELNDNAKNDIETQISSEHKDFINSQMKECLCKISLSDNINNIKNKTGSGFFSKVPFPDEYHLLPTLITSSKILRQLDIICGKSIIISTKGKKQIINIDKNRKRYYCKSLGIILIEIIPNVDNINSFLEIENELFNSNKEIINSKNIYIMQHLKIGNPSISYGKISSITGNNIEYSCTTEYDSTGGPILLIKNFKIIGMHSQRVNSNSGKGVFIYDAIDLFNKKYNQSMNKKIKSKEENEVKEKMNQITLTIRIDNDSELNKDIYFLYNVNEIESKNEEINNVINRLNDENTQLFIDNTKLNFTNFYKFDKKGKHKIKIIFNNEVNISDCSYMFYKCEYITSINLSNFNSNNVTNMKYMFSKCTKLSNINLYNLDASNVTDINNMFSFCENLTEIDLSFFKTEKVINMNSLFESCKNLLCLDLTSFNTTNVIDISKMFYNCKKVEGIDVSSFSTENIKNMKNLFSNCEKLSSLDLSSFNLIKVKNTIDIFQGCESLTSIKVKDDMKKVFVNLVPESTTLFI